MAVVLVSSDVFVQQKLASGSVHGCTLPDSLFQKADGKWYFFRSGTDAAGSKQQSVCLQTGSPKMYTDVHFWARMSVVPRNGDVFAPQKLAINASMEGRCTNQQRVLCTRTKLVFFRHTRMYVGKSVHGCTLLDRLFQKADG